ncbi:DUF763 domain-containing protein [Chelatococcus reniformis]|uniref:DUF763 domain-containing protein n=1 Tax=Chelatococcus reniformis TaxID=1494448 RepID=A0A916UIT3_9HYPH|nr:DUF763 domain-containing protein [Chelatococcus reniformis]GGC72472.1 hypothetical protein GCM10010994_33610 [Chelatococcus reniformis]
MARRAGSADLPLHNGRVPAWLGQRMARLGAVIAQAIVHHYGRDEFLRRLSHPFWFQSFGAVMGMDWHSSGITTSVIGALKRGLGPLSGELGLHVCGGRGSHSRQTPHELLAVGERVGFDGVALARASRLVAKVDSAAVQDGFELYLHGFIVADDGRWVVVQQGMNGGSGLARRYHWLSEGLSSFVEAPHAAIEGRAAGKIVNLTDRRAAASRSGQLDLVREGPDRVLRLLADVLGEDAPAAAARQPLLPHLVMPAHHDVRPKDVMSRRLHGALAAAADRGPADFAELLLVPGVGARTVHSLALVAEVIHGAPCRFADPARHALALGGKDRHPYPVPTLVYDRTIEVLKAAISSAKLGNGERLEAIRRLDAQTRTMERDATGPSLPAFVAAERRRSHEYGGRGVFGWEPPPPAERCEVRPEDDPGQRVSIRPALSHGRTP